MGLPLILECKENGMFGHLKEILTPTLASYGEKIKQVTRFKYLGYLILVIVITSDGRHTSEICEAVKIIGNNTTGLHQSPTCYHRDTDSLKFKKEHGDGASPCNCKAESLQLHYMLNSE
ncbi:hypothetical protein PoB_002772900 [Plakobranchus ocellatus]|uniref:Uncharacterized protein n=1 Tax=Plakobranchus ocellatus TaxID=259542 RepID=A0AAV4A3N8_9GAST|nr:hypothetical protein PoB_002772900 [Plakobranchus ocellatus]